MPWDLPNIFGGSTKPSTNWPLVGVVEIVVEAVEMVEMVEILVEIRAGGKKCGNIGGNSGKYGLIGGNFRSHRAKNN